MTSPMSHSASTRSKEDKNKAEKQRRDNVNEKIHRIFELAKLLNCHQSYHVSPRERKPTLLSKLDLVEKVLVQELNAKAGQVVVPAARHQQPTSLQIDHRLLHLAYYWTTHSSTGHIITCTAEIKYVNGYQSLEVEGLSPYEGFIHPDDKDYTLAEQQKMLFTSMTQSWVCYRIVKRKTNSQGFIEKEMITYQRSLCVSISSERFDLLNVQIGQLEFESYKTSINVPSVTDWSETATSPVNSQDSGIDVDMESEDIDAVLTQLGFNSVTSWTVGPAGPSDEWTPISPVNSELSSSAGGNVDLYEFDQLVASTIDPSSASGEGSVGVAGHLATSPTCSEDSGIWRDATEMDTFGSTDPSPFGTSYNYL